ncbi:phage tail protein [Paenibacillus sp. FSL R5-0527]|uniref:phage tail protein n=1 Tax=Paenibacillus sp. FSL R5-0527 TaxID=2975321 RepID=UPI00097B7A21|nr:hypothetical protein BK140_09435 [Paenibacillus macerans]
MSIKEPRKFVPTDQGHADVLNIPITTLYENDRELAAQVESIRSDPAGNGVVPKEAFEQYKQETQTQINEAVQTAKNYTNSYAAQKSHTHPASDLPSATTQTRGIVQLNTSTSSTATDQAATPSAVKAAYDLAAAASSATANLRLRINGDVLEYSADNGVTWKGVGGVKRVTRYVADLPVWLNPNRLYDIRITIPAVSFDKTSVNVTGISLNPQMNSTIEPYKTHPVVYLENATTVRVYISDTPVSDNDYYGRILVYFEVIEYS